MPAYCTNCGKELKDNTNFCTDCGNKVGKENIYVKTNETELFFSKKESIRKTGEKRYGKGTVKITDKALYLDYKKLGGKPEQYVISVNEIIEAFPRMQSTNLPVEPIGLGSQDWIILDIKTNDGSGFQLMIGQPFLAVKKVRNKMYQKYNKIIELLNTEEGLSRIPWKFEQPNK